MNEKDKLFRTIRRLLVIAAIAFGLMFLILVLGSAMQ
jgi:hypothetical protein